MNTFMPYPNYIKSTSCLDNKRLGKQRLEVLQIYNALTGSKFKKCPECGGNGKYDTGLPRDTIICIKCRGVGRIKKGWINHPAVKMWKGYEFNLIAYGICCCKEWKKRGFKDTLEDRFKDIIVDLEPTFRPDWVYDPKSISGYRSNLLRKDFKHYSQFGWTEPTNLPYIYGR